MTLALTVFQGRPGDHNDRGFGGAAAIGAEWHRRLGLAAAAVGTPEPPLSTGWRVELTAAATTLEAMSQRYEDIYAAGQKPVTALTLRRRPGHAARRGPPSSGRACGVVRRPRRYQHTRVEHERVHWRPRVSGPHGFVGLGARFGDRAGERGVGRGARPGPLRTPAHRRGCGASTIA
jgi:hypothetical protein